MLSPLLALAPMQRVTDYPFMKVISQYGNPDYYFTEYFRVHIHSKLDATILKSIDDNPTQTPIYAQLIGQDICALVRTAQELIKHPVKGIDLNLGCPAPIVCKKEAGGGLLKNLNKIDQILGNLRETIPAPFHFTVKTRVGYETSKEFDQLLTLFRQHEIDLLSIHGRTVKEGYKTPVHYKEVKKAVESMPCPVLANGNIVDVETGLSYQKKTGAAGLMIGRGAIRNPWIFTQLRQAFAQTPICAITSQDLLEYIHLLWEETAMAFQVPYHEEKQVHKMKRYMNYITQGLPSQFEHDIRRVKTKNDFFFICDQYLAQKSIIPSRPSEKSKLFCGFSDLLR